MFNWETRVSHEYCVEGSIIILPILIPEQAFIKHKLAIAKVIVIFVFQISNSALAPKRKFYFLDLCKILHIKEGTTICIFQTLEI